MDEQAEAQEIMRLEDEFMDATKRRDVDALNRIMAPEYVLITTAGKRVVTKDGWMQTALERITITGWEYVNPDVRIYGEGGVTGVVETGRIQKATTSDGKPWNSEAMLLDIWMKRDGQWQIVTRMSRPATLTADSASSGAASGARPQTIE